MEFNGCRMNEVSDPVDFEFYYRGRSLPPSPVPVLTTNVCCDLEDILSD
ncbi:jg508, partial [Pararge aegeria aegeria]